ncbi:multidrug effflux MFS transporter [Oceanospirillum sediminis]|uniref:Multidrug effflux MFS transporter n=1 Tax=Oceanospirillum sediminis TaxID=2760088 RepID=A0A839ISS7_9GAMM|nr:multidrug effflux MFS transporter [Oceanospirillum sediminis]MBB1487642.1 multidrug effflux MFS transporter [Oceanospirillum sediminis]
MSTRTKTAPMPMLLAMATASPVALNIFAPVMPELAESFAADPFTVQLGFTLYLLTLAIGQFLSGPLADRFGRRPVLLWGFIIHILGCLLGALATDIAQLLVGRILQALGGCTGMLLARSILVQQHGRDQAAGYLGYITLGIAASQAIAPTLGGYLNLTAGWTSVFYLSLVMGCMVWLAAIWYLPEDELSSEKRSITQVFSSYREVLRNRQYLMMAMSSTLIASCFFTFITSAPFVVAQNLTGDSADYGNWFLMVAGGFFAGSMVAGKTSAKLGVNRMIPAGHSLSLLAASLMLIMFLLSGVSYFSLFLPMALFTFGRGLSQPSAQSVAIGSVASAATASGMLGFIQLLAGSALAQITPLLMQINLIMLPVTMILAVVLALLCFYQSKK